MKVVYNNYIPFKGFLAMNFLGIWLFVRRVKYNGEMLDPRLSVVTLNHENIHSAQYKETAFIGFLVWYLIEWIVRVVCEFVLWAVRSKNCAGFGDILHAAYRNVTFEQEAYRKQYNLTYNNHRAYFQWINYLFERHYE